MLWPVKCLDIKLELKLNQQHGYVTERAKA